MTFKHSSLEPWPEPQAISCYLTGAGKGGLDGGRRSVTSSSDRPGPGSHTSRLLLGLGVDATAEAPGSRGQGLTGATAPMKVAGRPGRRSPSGRLCSSAK